MFDFSDLELHDSIAKYNQKQILEAERAKIENRNKSIENLIEAINQEYNNLYNTQLSKAIDRKLIREAAVIHAVNDALYGIFESALLVDDNVKIEYRDNLKSIFESHFYQILKENNVKTLSQFKNFVKKSHGIIENVIERAEKLVELNESVYFELLENTFNSTSIDNLIMEASKAAADPGATVDEKVAKARAMVDKLSEDFKRFTLEQKFASAHRIIQAAIVILKLGVAIDRIWYTLLDKLLTIINSIFGKETTTSLRQKLENKTLKEVENYYYVAIDVAITLKKLQKKFPPDSKDYIKLGDRIVSIYKAIVIINDYRQDLINKMQNKPLKEASYTEFLTECDVAASDESSQKVIIDALKEKLNESFVEFEPIVALESVQLANKITSDPVYHNVFIESGNSGSNATLVIIKGLKDSPIDKFKSQFIKEAKIYKKNLESIIETAREAGKFDQVLNMVRQARRLESVISEFEQNGNLGRKLIRESVSPLLATEHKVGADILASTISEAAQFILLYEASKEDLQYLTKLVNEANECNEDEEEDLKTLGRVIRDEVDEDNTPEEIVKESINLESAIYRKLYMADPEGISEAAASELKKGKYPKLSDFLDKEDKELIDSIVSISGKDKVVDVIRAKIIDVIEGEEKRIKKMEEEEEKLISKLTKKQLTTNEDLQEAVRSLNNGLNEPKTLFEAIVMNRTKKYIQEAISLGTGFDINMHKNTLMGEAIAIMTIHETFNTLQFGNYDSSKLNKLRIDYTKNRI